MSTSIRRCLDGVLRGRGCLEGCCGAVLVEDGGGDTGGQSVWAQVASDLWSIVSGPRGKGKSVRLVALDWKVSTYKQLLGVHETAGISFVDCHSDPQGWRAQRGGSHKQADDVVNVANGLAAIEVAAISVPEQILANDSDEKTIVVVDSLTTLLLQYSLHQVIQFLDGLRCSDAIGGMVLRVYTDVHQEPVISALEVICTSILRVGKPSGLQRTIASSLGTSQLHGEITIRQKIHTGRVVVEKEWFSLAPSGGVATFQPPTEMRVDAKQAALAAMKGLEPSQSDNTSLESNLMKDMDGGMKLTLTSQERRAKEAVVLPYEKSQGAQCSELNVAQESLGEIHYVRDSESEYDSDEDPDEDLDI
eukprot:evm.model.scf_1053EXC.4 EVM.evm.TU.scf_1053EXC.4   scf_1053EXC:11690-17260(+)